MTTLTKGTQETKQDKRVKVNAELWSKFNLTHRQREIATLMCEGLSNQQIGALCFITEKAVKFHVTNILKVCQLTNRKELIQLIDKLCKRG